MRLFVQIQHCVAGLLTEHGVSKKVVVVSLTAFDKLGGAHDAGR
jgi:hypothetical protein